MPPTPMQAWFSLPFGAAARKPEGRSDGVAKLASVVDLMKRRRDSKDRLVVITALQHGILEAKLKRDSQLAIQDFVRFTIFLKNFETAEIAGVKPASLVHAAAENGAKLLPLWEAELSKKKPGFLRVSSGNRNHSPVSRSTTTSANPALNVLRFTERLHGRTFLRCR
jgi:hypothetical protein